MLQQKREKIRTLQQRKTLSEEAMKDLPAEIPLSLVIGTKVTGMACSNQYNWSDHPLSVVSMALQNYILFYTYIRGKKCTNNGHFCKLEYSSNLEILYDKSLVQSSK